MLCIPGVRRDRIDGWTQSRSGEAPVIEQFHVRRPLEFVEQHPIDGRGRPGECCRDHGQASAFLKGPPRTERPPGEVDCVHVDRAMQFPRPRCRDRVVGPGKTGERVEEEDHVSPLLGHATRTLEGHVCDLHVAAGRLVERGCEHLCVHRTVHDRDLFRSSIDQYDHDRRIGGTLTQGLDQRGDHEGAPTPRRGLQQDTMTEPDRCDQVDEANGRLPLGDGERPIREDRRQVVEQDLLPLGIR